MGADHAVPPTGDDSIVEMHRDPARDLFRADDREKHEEPVADPDLAVGTEVTGETKLVVRGPESGVRGPESGVRGPGFGVRSLRSGVRDPSIECHFHHYILNKSSIARHHAIAHCPLPFARCLIDLAEAFDIVDVNVAAGGDRRRGATDGLSVFDDYVATLDVAQCHFVSQLDCFDQRNRRRFALLVRKTGWSTSYVP